MKSVSTKFTLPESFFIPLPAFPVIVLFLSTSVPLSMVELNYVTEIKGWILAGLLPIFSLVILPISLRKWFFWTLFGLVITQLHIQAPWFDYAHYLPRPELYVEVEGVVVDDKLIKNDSLEWIQEQKRFKFKLNKLRLSRHENWQECTGKILIINPNEVIEYRQKLRLKGRLILPDENVIPGTFNYRNFLRIHNIKHILVPNETILLGVDNRVWSRCLIFLNTARTRILYQLSKNINNVDNKSILASLTFGIKSNFDKNIRTNYLRSGMMHLFAISGLHVGILFSIIFGILSLFGLPYQKKYLISPLLLLIYVFMTGSAPSAVRAWLMLAVWSAGKGFKLPAVTLNTLLASALILLIYNPLYVFHSGFQFSYVLVFSLVIGWNKGRLAIVYLNEVRLWSVNTKPHNLFSISGMKGYVLKALLSMMSVWLGTVGLSAFYNGLFLPTTILTNIMVCGFVWIIIFASVVKVSLAVFLIQLPDYFIGKFLSINLDFVRLLSELSSNYGWIVSIEKPSVMMTLVYYVILFLLFVVPKNLKQFSLALMLLVGFVFAHEFGHNLFVNRPQIYVFLPEGSIVPSVVIIPEKFAKEPIVLNSGTRRLGYQLTSFLELKGVKGIKKLILLDNRSNYYSGLYSVSERFDINALIVCNSDRRNIAMLQRLGWASHAKIRFFRNIQTIKFDLCRIELDKTKDVKQFNYNLKSDNQWLIKIDIIICNNKRTNIEISVTNLDTNLTIMKDWAFYYNDHHVFDSLN